MAYYPRFIECCYDAFSNFEKYFCGGAYIPSIVSSTDITEPFFDGRRTPFHFPLCHSRPKPSKGGCCVDVYVVDSMELLTLVWFNEIGSQCFDCSLTVHTYDQVRSCSLFNSKNLRLKYTCLFR